VSDPNELFYSLVVMNGLFASLAWCLAKPNRMSINSTLVFAVVWPFVNGRLEGRTLAVLSPGHGITESDFLSVFAVVVAAVQMARRVRARASVQRSAPARPYSVVPTHRPPADRPLRVPSARRSHAVNLGSLSADRLPTVPIPSGDTRRPRVA